MRARCREMQFSLGEIRDPVSRSRVKVGAGLRNEKEKPFPALGAEDRTGLAARLT